MNKFEEMAKAAASDAAAAKAARDADAATSRAAMDAREAQVRSDLETNVIPVLVDVVRGLKAAGLDAEQLPPKFPFPLEQHIRIGHNRGNRTSMRIATLTISANGGRYEATVESGNGSDKKWEVEEAPGVRAMIETAVADCLNRWHEQNGYPHRPMS